MKIRNIALIFALLLCLSAFGKKIPGYIVALDSTKQDVVFEVKMNLFSSEPNYVQLQTSVNYLQGGQSVNLYPGDCIKIGLNLPEGMVEFISVPNYYSEETKVGGNYLFLRPKIIGPVSQYYFYYIAYTTGPSATGGTFTSSSMVNGWILQNDLGPYKVLVRGNSKREEFIKLFFDYADLCTKIESKQIDKRDIEFMVNTYNYWKTGL